MSPYFGLAPPYKACSPLCIITLGRSPRISLLDLTLFIYYDDIILSTVRKSRYPWLDYEGEFTDDVTTTPFTATRTMESAGITNPDEIPLSDTDSDDPSSDIARDSSEDHQPSRGSQPDSSGLETTARKPLVLPQPDSGAVPLVAFDEGKTPSDVALGEGKTPSDVQLVAHSHQTQVEDIASEQRTIDTSDGGVDHPMPAELELKELPETGVGGGVGHMTDHSPTSGPPRPKIRRRNVALYSNQDDSDSS